MPKLRTTCARCGKPYTPEEMAARKLERSQNALNSRAKAAANGKQVRRPRFFEHDIAVTMGERGVPVWKIAEKFGVSESSIYRALKKSRDQPRPQRRDA